VLDATFAAWLPAYFFLVKTLKVGIGHELVTASWKQCDWVCDVDTGLVYLERVVT